MAYAHGKFCKLHLDWVRLRDNVCVHCGRVPKVRYVPFLLARHGKISKDVARLLAERYIPNAWCDCACKDTRVPQTIEEFVRIYLPKRVILVYDDDQDTFDEINLEEALKQIE
jgi:hypothetical protein